MEELYSIMRDLLEIEYNQRYLLCVLKALEATNSNEEQEMVRVIANGTRYYFEALQKELKAIINRLDTYMAEKEQTGKRMDSYVWHKAAGTAACCYACRLHSF